MQYSTVNGGKTIRAKLFKKTGNLFTRNDRRRVSDSVDSVRYMALARISKDARIRSVINVVASP